MQFLEAVFAVFYTVCSLEVNVKMHCGHLPFSASLVYIA